MDGCISCPNFVGFSFLPFLLVFGLIATLSQRPLQSISVPGLLVLLITVSVTFSIQLRSLMDLDVTPAQNEEMGPGAEISLCGDGSFVEFN